MLWYGEVIGVIHVLHDTQKHKFTEDDLKLLTSFANQAAVVVENARLFEETQRRLDRLSALRRIDQVITNSLDLRVTLNIMLGQIVQLLEIDAAAVLLYQPELQNLEFVAGQGFRTRALQSTTLHLGRGFAGQAALERRIIRVFDAQKLHDGFLRSPEFRGEEFVAYIGVPLIAKGNIIGVLEIYNRQEFGPDEEWMDFLDTLAGQAAIAIDNINLFNNLEMSNLELIQAYQATIEGWARALELRDMETEGHSRRVVDMTVELARRLGIKEAGLMHVRRGALLHDIGKMGVPDSILQKTGSLTDEEWEIIRQHPVYANKWLSPIAYLKPALDIPYCHHEKWDGTGYPQGLKGEQIPLAARIFAIVDVWDALTSDRPYRSAWTEKKTLEYIKEQSGQHFDPKVVEAFLRLIDAD
jgi:HD-GYP domain-containing protein (c-di-GMP phosphodiesterase class II)